MYKDIHTVADLALVQAVDTTSPIQCRTCHNAHNPDKLLLDETKIGDVVTVSAQYNTCTNCHQRHDAQVGAEVAPLPGSTSTDGSSGDLIYHAGRWTRVISSTHYDNPATADIIEGYNLNPASNRVCLDCHNVHSADITINGNGPVPGTAAISWRPRRPRLLPRPTEPSRRSLRFVPPVL